MNISIATLLHVGTISEDSIDFQFDARELKMHKCFVTLISFDRENLTFNEPLFGKV